MEGIKITQGKIDSNKEIKCPRCKEESGGYTGLNNKAPGPGDIAICVYCKSINQYQEDMTLLEAPLEIKMGILRQIGIAQNKLKDIN